MHSSDSYPLVYPPGSKGRNPATNVKGDSHFWLKDSLYSLHDMFDSKKMGIEDLVNEHFVGGTVYQAFLDPFCYHRWHSPVSGTILYSYLIEGSFYLDNPGLPLDGKDNYVNSHPMLSVISTRQVFIIQLDDGSGRLVAIIEIGMGEVSGCQPTVVQSQLIKKGEELGYFAFGGSSYAMVFDKGLELEFNKEAFIVDTKAKPGKVQARKQKVNSLLCSFR